MFIVVRRINDVELYLTVEGFWADLKIHAHRHASAHDARKRAEIYGGEVWELEPKTQI